MAQRVGSTAQRLKDLPYEKRVCRIEHYPTSLQMHGITGKRDESRPYASMEEEVDAIADAGTQVWSITCYASRGIPMFPSKILTPPDNLDMDAIPRFLDLAHERGIIVLTYYPFIFNHQLKEIHPEWAIKMLDDGGEEVWDEGWSCWNSPFRDWLPELISEGFDHLDFDGVYFDDMNWGTHSDAGQRRVGGCHCDYCRKQLLEETGLELQQKVDMDSVDFRRYVNWRYDKFVDAMAHFSKKLHERHPDHIVDWNYYCRPYGTPDTGWMTAHPLNPMDVGSFQFVEAGLDNLGSGIPTKICQALGEKTFGIWLWATQTLVECISHSAPYPEPHVPLIYGLNAVAHGGGSVTTCLDAGDHSIHGNTLKSVFSELVRLRDHIGEETVKYLGLHVSQQTRDFAPPYRHEPDLWWRQLRGSHEMMSRSHVLTDYIFDRHLADEKKLSQYSVLFLSNSVCLSSAEAEAIRSFATNGGTVVATHQTSLCDELGQQQDDFQLADLFGVSYKGESTGVPESDDAKDTGQMKLYGRTSSAEHSNIYVPQSDEMSARFGRVICFGAPNSIVELTAGSTAEVLCTKSSLTWENGPPLQDFYSEMQYDSGEPAVTVNNVGKGKAIYICGDVGSGYDLNPLPQLKRFVASMLETTAAPIEVDGPRVIELSATWRGEKEVSVHLLNNPLPLLPWSIPSANHRSYLYLEEVVPVHDVVLKLNGFTVKKATAPLTNQKLSVENNGSTVTVPVIGPHELVSLSLA
jgi:hypothetical protein